MSTYGGFIFYFLLLGRNYQRLSCATYSRVTCFLLCLDSSFTLERLFLPTTPNGTSAAACTFLAVNPCKGVLFKYNRT